MAAAPNAPNTSLPPIADAAPVEVTAAAPEVFDASLPPVVEDGEELVVEAPEEAAPANAVAVRPVAFVQADGMEAATPVTKLTGAH
jgi:hypothetical protein